MAKLIAMSNLLFQGIRYYTQQHSAKRMNIRWHKVAITSIIWFVTANICVGGAGVEPQSTGREPTNDKAECLLKS